ncbi:MAG: hypothetical protein QM777_17495 [Pseudorhodoferax sp.]
MADERQLLKPCEEPGQACAENGLVILEGPEGVAVTMTAEAAEQTADSLRAAARQARGQSPRQQDGLGD